MSKITQTENASRLNESAMSGMDLSCLTPDNWLEIGKLINGFALSAKSDAINCNPSVLFIKTAKVLKDRCDVARLPENVANTLREKCNNVAIANIEAMQLEGFVPHRISATKARVDTRNLAVGTQRTVAMRRDNHSPESQLYMLNSEIGKLEKAIAKRQLEYKDTEQQEAKLAAWQKLQRVLKMEIAEKKAEQAAQG